MVHSKLSHQGEYLAAAARDRSTSNIAATTTATAAVSACPFAATHPPTAPITRITPGNCAIGMH